MQDIDNLIVFGRFRMDLTRRTLFADGQPVALHARAFDILEYLVARRDGPVTRDEIIGHVWRGMTVGENNLSVQMSTLRRVLSQHGGDNLVLTVPHRGYQFVESTLPATAFNPAEALPEPTKQTILDRPGRARVQLQPNWAITAVAALLLLAIAAWQLAPTSNRLPPRSAEAFDPPPHSIAVLAFANMSGDPAQEYFSDGVSDELIDTLSHVRQLQVVSRTSSFYFKGHSATAGEIARTLDVRNIMEGSVRRQGTRVRISVELSDAKTGYQLWSESFDRDQSALLDVQREIASSVSHALQLTILGDDDAKLTLGNTTNAQAFDHYLHGVQLLRAGGTTADASIALSEFDAALSLDSNFALAECGRANALSSIGQLGTEMTPADRRKAFFDARDAADRAVALAPNLGSSHAARGLALKTGFSDHQGAMAELQRAATLDPGNATIEIIYSDVAMSVGRTDEALASGRRAVQLDPLRADAWWDLGFELYSARQYEQALTALQRGKAIAGALPAPFSTVLGLVLLERGNPQEAQQACSASGSLECLTLAYHALHKPQETDLALSKLHTSLGDRGAFSYAEVAAQWGHPAEALMWLRRAANLKDPDLADLKTDPLLDPVRNTSQFLEFERQFNLSR